MLLHPRFTSERLGNHGRRIVIAVAGKIPDRHLGVGYRRLDHRFDIAGVHRHPVFLQSSLSKRRAQGAAMASKLSANALLRHALSTIFPFQSLIAAESRHATAQGAKAQGVTMMKLP